MASKQTPSLLAPVTSAANDTSLTAFRFSTYDVPFWTRNNTRAARWNRAHEDPTQYWSLCPESSWAELIRYENLRTEEELDEIKMPLWVCRIPKLGLLDLRDPGNQKRWGLTEDDIVSDDWAATQTAATAMRAVSIPGILTFSAALPEHTNVTLFGARRMVDWHSRPALTSALAATLVAIGRPPPGIIPDVTRAGSGHPSQLRFDDDAA